MNWRNFFTAAIAAAVVLGWNQQAWTAEGDFPEIKAEIAKRHDESIKRLQEWIHQVSIAAENRGYPEGAEYMAKLARDAGFQQATVINTDGKPGVFATLDAGAAKTVGLYFMYDVKQFDPAEWTSPPTEARLVDKPPLGKAIVGRGAVNQKGPEAAFLAALHAIKGAGKKMPVNLVMVAEGEEENRFAAHSADRAQAGSAGGAGEMHRRVHAFGDAGSGWRRDGEPRLQRRDRARAGLERRKMGTRPGQRHSFIAQSDDRQSGMAFGSRAQHARVGRR